jgi:DNA repair exonuclease SbcCD ATPase subunit
MSIMNTLQSDPQIIFKSYEKIRADFQRKEKQIATKQDIAARKKDKELVEQASTYTPETVFQGLAQLQTHFGQFVEELSKQMSTEVEKLAQIQKAIQVETQHLETLHNIQIAAEALNILQQEHQNTLQNLTEEYRQKHEQLEQKMTKQREVWQKTQADYEKQTQKQDELLKKQRETEEGDYHYQAQWQHTKEADEYDQQKRALERRLQEEQKQKEKDWQEREKYLAKHQAEFDEYKVKVENIPKELEEAMKKAREEAIKDTYKEEENKAKLRDKEMESKRKAFELKIESLNKTVERQKIRITQLNEQLQTASQQVQQLAMTAVATSTSSSPTKTERKTASS